MPIKFLIKGSSPEPYTATFHKKGNNLSAYCTCAAGINGMHCKHRLDILNGSSKSIVSDNQSDVTTITQWLAGTDVEAALQSVQSAEQEATTAKKKLAAAKKQLAAAMKDKHGCNLDEADIRNVLMGEVVVSKLLGPVK